MEDASEDLMTRSIHYVAWLTQASRLRSLHGCAEDETCDVSIPGLGFLST